MLETFRMFMSTREISELLESREQFGTFGIPETLVSPRLFPEVPECWAFIFIGRPFWASETQSHRCDWGMSIIEYLDRECGNSVILPVRFDQVMKLSDPGWSGSLLTQIIQINLLLL